MSDTQSEDPDDFRPRGKEQSDEEYQKETKNKSKSKGKQRVSKQKKNNTKQQKEEGKKQKKAKKQPRKKKQKVSKAKSTTGDPQQDIQNVKVYMQKQNRPYSLINVYDNLHGKIKKNALQGYLDQLSSEQFLTCKQFGKNKVYFLNQNRFDINNQQLEALSSKLTQKRQEYSQLEIDNKALGDEFRILTASKTNQQLQTTFKQLSQNIEKLQKKKKKVTQEIEQKIDESKVMIAENQQVRLSKKLKKLRRLKKESVDIWCQILQKKKVQVAEILGIEL